MLLMYFLLYPQIHLIKSINFDQKLLFFCCCFFCYFLEPTSFKIPFSNFKPSINKYILEEWQTSWNNSIGNKLLDIKLTIGEYQSVVRNIRREEVVLARLRLGHTRVTHSYLLQGEEQPQCVGCDAPFTVRHFLLECGDFAQVRKITAAMLIT